jgi:hypothetical protein
MVLRLIKWISENKEWLFSGIGVAILGLLFAIFRKRFGRRSESVSGSKEPNTILEPRSESASNLKESNVTEKYPSDKVSTLRFEDIREAIKNAVPLQRDAVKKYYEGINVEWEGYLKHASEFTEGSVLIWLAPGPTDRDALFTIVCYVLLSDYPELRVLREGSKIRVKGMIKEAGQFGIELDKVTLWILERK